MVHVHNRRNRNLDAWSPVHFIWHAGADSSGEAPEGRGKWLLWCWLCGGDNFLIDLGCMRYQLIGSG